MSERIPIICTRADGTEIKGTARMRGGTIDDYRTERGGPMPTPPGCVISVAVTTYEPIGDER